MYDYPEAVIHQKMKMDPRYSLDVLVSILQRVGRSLALLYSNTSRLNSRVAFAMPAELLDAITFGTSAAMP